ncbi:MAG TPA: response regulator [Urbifossiella sp.]|nr:response regulator [Urbifossiella sp.]
MTPRVLIVDDSLTVRMDLEEAFEEAGFLPVPCADLAAARRAVAAGPVALAVLDVLLPDGDGIDLLGELRADPATAATPVLLLSTEADVRDRVRGLAVGADGYLGKPYDRDGVIDRARELVRRRAAPPGAARAPLVLVIDDSPTFREELREALEAAGYAVRTAGTGEEGLRLAAQLRPDGVVVDGQLPGIDGAAVAARLRATPALRHVPCLLLTASGGKGDEVRALDAGADGYVRKEEGTDVVLSRLTTLLRSAVAPTPLARQIAPAGPSRVLAVDDSPTFLDAVARELEAEGYEVLRAGSGEEALRVLAGQPVDCVLLDLVMPGLTGEETCRRIKALPGGRDVPVMILTAHQDQEALLSCLKAGADDYIPKAVEFDVLKGRARAQLRRKQYEGENRLIQEVVSTLRKSEALLGGLFESAPDAIVVSDRAGRIVRVNAQAEAVFGYPRAEVLGRPVEVLVPERFRDRHEALRRAYLADHRRVIAPDRELWGRRKDGSEFPADIVLGPVPAEDGLLVLATVRDVTRRRETELALRAKTEEVREVSQQLWQSAKLATMGELAASIAHELNNPLGTLTLGIEELLTEAPPGSPAHRELKVMEQETARMARLVANLLQFSRPGHQQVSTFAVAEEVEKTLELSGFFLRKRAVTVDRRVAPGLPMIQGDRQQLRQVFLNLIVNASDAMPPGGTLTIRIGPGGLADGQPAVVLEFTDTGVGIPPENLAKIMEPFFTTKEAGKGTGLGLAICRRIVQEHRGAIDIASAAGRGTTVRLTLPVRSGENGDHLNSAPPV